MMGFGDPDARPRRPLSRLTVLRWGMAAVLVMSAHATGAWVALNWHRAESLPNDPPPAVMIELAPLAVAPPAPSQDVAPSPQQQTEAEPEPTPDTPAPVEDAPPDPTPPDPPQQVVEDVKPDPAPAPQPDEKLPELPRKDEAAAVLTPPPPPPKPKPKPHRKPPKRHVASRKKPLHPDKRRVHQTTAPPTSQSRRADRAAAPASGASFAPSMSPATWKGALMAHLNRYKRYPAGATGGGTASVAFTINRAGQVLSSRLIRSSGDRTLDIEAASLPRRASPVPAPPPNVGGGVITLTVPIHFGG
jgi:protein TonB